MRGNFEKKLNLKSIVILVFLLTMVFFCVLSFEGAYAQSKVNESSQADLRKNQRVLTVVMYHQILKHGPKSRYIVTPTQFENDLIELLARGFETVLPAELHHFVEFGGEFPKKPLLLTFDDGHYNNLFYAKPILEKYNCRAVLNIIGAFSEYSTTSGDHSNVNYSHMTWQQIKQAHDSGVFEIGNHSYNMHKFSPRKGVLQKNGESDKTYVKEISADILRLQQKLQSNCQLSPICFAYPFGAYNKLTQKVLTELGFKVILNCIEKTNVISVGDNQCLLNLCRFNRESTYTAASFFEKIEKAKVNSNT